MTNQRYKYERHACVTCGKIVAENWMIRHLYSGCVVGVTGQETTKTHQDKPDHEPINPGTQILYVPYHAHGNINHPDVEEGFVTSIKGEGEKQGFFCRFWRVDRTGRPAGLGETSQRCYRDQLVVKDTRRQKIIDDLMVSLGYIQNV